MKNSFEILIMVIVGVTCLALIKNLIDMGKKSAESIDDDRVRFAFKQVLDLAETIVNSLNQTVVEPLKNSDKLEFDKKAQREVLEKAKARIKDNLDDKSKEILRAYLGSRGKLDEFIEDSVEAKVFEAKK